MPPISGKATGYSGSGLFSPAERLIEVEHADVAEVGHARHCLEEPEPLDGAPVKDHVKHLEEKRCSG